MKRTHILYLAALIALGLGVLSSPVLLLNVTDAQPGPRANPIDVMQMMRDAKDLPVQAYDAT
jgi:hypothetical protein